MLVFFAGNVNKIYVLNIESCYRWNNLKFQSGQNLYEIGRKKTFSLTNVMVENIDDLFMIFSI